MQVNRESLDLTQVFITLHAFVHALCLDADLFQTGCRIKDIGIPTSLRGNMILCQAEETVDFRTHQLTDAGDILYDVVAIMDDEFEIERGDGPAGITFAGGAVDDAADMIAKGCIS